MIIRKYEDKDGGIMEIAISEDDPSIVNILTEYEGTYVSVELDYNDICDLHDRLYEFKRKIEPVSAANGHN